MVTPEAIKINLVEETERCKISGGPMLLGI
jgi:hypothetical protein